MKDKNTWHFHAPHLADGPEMLGKYGLTISLVYFCSHEIWNNILVGFLDDKIYEILT